MMASLAPAGLTRCVAASDRWRRRTLLDLADTLPQRGPEVHRPAVHSDPRFKGGSGFGSGDVAEGSKAQMRPAGADDVVGTWAALIAAAQCLNLLRRPWVSAPRYTATPLNDERVCSETQERAFVSIHRNASCCETNPGMWSCLPCDQATRTYHPGADFNGRASKAGSAFDSFMIAP
jgi:hypothetical protein